MESSDAKSANRMVAVLIGLTMLAAGIVGLMLTACDRIDDPAGRNRRPATRKHPPPAPSRQRLRFASLAVLVGITSIIFAASIGGSELEDVGPARRPDGIVLLSDVRLIITGSFGFF